MCKRLSAWQVRLHGATRRAYSGSAVAWGAAFLVVDCFLALSVGALAVTQARLLRPAVSLQ